MSDDYRMQSNEDLLTHLSRNPTDTPVWINSRVELERRREEKLIRWTRTLAVSTVLLVIATVILAICTATEVYLRVRH
jgi:hypothetical protein